MHFPGLRPFTGAIFDLDGTLLDSMGVWEQIDIDFLGKRGLTPPPDYTAAITPLSFRATAEYTIARFSLTETPEQLMEEWSGMARERYHHHISLKPGTRELLSALHQMGVPMGIATTLSPGLALPCLRRNGIDGFFTAMVTSDEVGAGKAAPLVWQEAARRLGLPAGDCAALDDVADALRGAKAAGMQTVGVYDPYSTGREELRAAADILVENLNELSAAIIL